MPVPFVNLRAQHDELRAELLAAFESAIDESAFIGGPRVESFERAFAAYCGAGHAVSCASGTDALRLALMAAGVGKGDAVITTPHTFIATTEAITQVGASPILVDIDLETYNLAPAAVEGFLAERCVIGADGRPVERATGLRVKALLPVHLYGLPADMSALSAIAARHGLALIEDACQAHGSHLRFDGADRRAGSMGLAGAFSFYPGKNLGALGEGGAVTTDDAGLAAQMRVWRDHGSREKYLHISPDGWNARLDALQAAVLELKLACLDGWNDARRRAAGWYRERLAGDGRVILPVEPAGSHHVYHLFIVRLADREAARIALSEQGIGVGLHYPTPLHLQPCYADLGYHCGDLPNAELAAASILSLPMFPHITEQQIDTVCEALVAHLDTVHAPLLVAA